MNIMNRIIKIFIISLVFLVTSSNYNLVSAQDTTLLQQQLDTLNAQIKQIQSEKSHIQSQIDSNNYTIQGYNSQLSNLYGQAKILDDQIQTLQLQIQQLDIQINQINSNISNEQAQIDQTQKQIDEYQGQSTNLISDSYVNFRLYGDNNPFANTIMMKNINTYFKNSQYKEFIQADTNKLLQNLASLQLGLSSKKLDLQSQLIAQKKAQNEVQLETSNLVAQKQEQNIKMSQYLAGVSALQSSNSNIQVKVYAMNQQQIQTQADANKLQEEIFNNFIPTSQGQYISSGTIIGKKGCTGLCSGAHLHFMVFVNGQIRNPCGYLPQGTIGGCGVSNSALSSWPLKGGMSITSGYGNRCFWWGNRNYCDFHNGIDLVSDPWNAPVFSPMAGYVHKGVDRYGANFVIVCQNDNCNGMKLGFWHLSAY